MKSCSPSLSVASSHAKHIAVELKGRRRPVAVTIASGPMMSHLSRLLFLALLLMVSPWYAFGQSAPQQTDGGVKAYQTYDGVREKIALASGNVNVSVPLIGLPGRNGHDFNLSLNYNSQLWSISEIGNTLTWIYDFGIGVDTATGSGWHLSSGMSVTPTRAEWLSSTIVCVGGYMLRLGEGSVHTFSSIHTGCVTLDSFPPGQPAPANNVPVGMDDTGQYIQLDTTQHLVTFKDGTQSDYGSSFIDTNGNVVSISNNTDTVGRKITYLYNSPISGAISGVQYLDSNGVLRTIALQYTSLPFSCSFPAPSNVAQSTASPALLSAIILPNGLSYTFQYTGCGELNKVTYPGGGYSRYDYGNFTHLVNISTNNNGIISEFVTLREVVAKYVCRAATTPEGAVTSPPGNTCPVAEDKTTYAPAAGTWNNAGNDVTDPLGNLTSYQFTQGGDSLHPPRETSRAIYQGASTVLETIQTAYANGLYPSSQTTILANGLQSQIQWDYEATPFVGPGQIDNVTEEREYDYGSGAPGPLVRRTDSTWLTINPVNGRDYTDSTGFSTFPPVAGLNIWNRKTGDKVYDGAGNLKAQAVYEYDNYTAGIVASGAVQHGTSTNSYGPSYVTRGNLTALKRWRSTDGAWLTTTFQYDDAGNVVSTTDPLQHTTTYSYADSWGDTTCAPVAGPAAAYRTKVTDPLTHQSQSKYNSCTGTVSSVTDPNNQAATFTYDLMDRQIAAVAPDNGQASTCFSDTVGAPCYSPSLPIQVVRTNKITASLSKISTEVLDGLGRTVQTQLNSDPTGADYVDVAYDALGRKATQSNPHRTTSLPTDGITQFQYDALNRPTQTTKQDGSIINISYSGNCTTTTDEANNQHKACADALGRLIEVDEPGGGSAGTNSAGTFTVTGTLQSVTVGGQSATPATGTVTINPSTGADRSITVQGQAAISGTGSVTISGSERSVTVDPCGGQNGVHCPHTIWDAGPISITVNGHANSSGYGQSSTSSNIASNMATSINTDSANSVTATASGTTVFLTAKTAGASTNYTLSSSSATSDATDFSGPSFTLTRSGATLIGGADAATTTVYDAGTVTIGVNGHNDQVLFGQNDTAAILALRLATAINGDSAAFVTASASGNVVTLTSKTTGTAANAALTSTYTYDTAHWNSAFFTTSNSGTTLAGGTNAVGGTTIFDAGTVSATVGGFTANAAYNLGGNSTAAQVASALATALSVSGSPVTATASGASVSVSYGTVGSVGNTAVTVNASTSQGAYFAGPSFTSPGAALVGGTDPATGSLSTPYITLYQHDVLDDLLRVDQKGSAPSDNTQWRTRAFTYDSLSHLLTANHPESGTISYAYDQNGNLSQKISPAPNQADAATQTITFCYDALNRVTGKAYSGQTCQNGQLPQGTAVVSYTYDQGTNGIGHTTSLIDQAGSGSYTYDAMGRLTGEVRTISGVSNPISYAYNFDGSVKTLTYPSGAVVTYTMDSAGRTVSATDSASGINYANAATYSPHNSLNSFVSGNSGTFPGITNSFSYNNRLQPVNMSASTPSQTIFSIGYDFHFNNGDNGNVYGITDYKDVTRNQSFTYDALNRITSAQNAGTDCTQSALQGKTKFWGNSYGYDAWGNLLSKTSTKCSSEGLSVTALGTNRLLGYGYDAAGNMTHDATSGLTYTFDPENRLTGAAGYTYTYDAEGNRVKKANGSTGTLYWMYYGTKGAVAESDLAGNLQSEYIFFNGGRVARRDLPGNTVAYYFSDHLNSASVISDSAGNIKSESDYLPWGGEIQYSAADSNHYKFTGKERDAETCAAGSCLDYFGARYYANALGRFISSDPGPFNVANPQSLNRYLYALDNPFRYVDPDGRTPFPTDALVTLDNFYQVRDKLMVQWAADYQQGWQRRELGRFPPGASSGLKQSIRHNKDLTNASLPPTLEFYSYKNEVEQYLVNQVTTEVQAWISDPNTSIDDLKGALISLEGTWHSSDIPGIIAFIVPEVVNKLDEGLKRIHSPTSGPRNNLILRLESMIEAEIKRREAEQKKKEEEANRCKQNPGKCHGMTHGGTPGPGDNTEPK